MAADPPSRPIDLQAAAQALRVDRWTAEAMRALAAAGVDALLLKGPALGRWLYDASEVRGYGDADVLVAPDRVSAAERVLEGLGYALKDPEGERRDMVSGPHARTWWRGADEAVVDLHHTLPGGVWEAELAWTVLWRRASRLALGEVEVPILDEPSRAVLVALHAAHHGPVAPRPLEDLRRAVRRGSAQTWREAALVAGELLVPGRFADGLALVPEGRRLAVELGLAPGGRGRALQAEPLAAGYERLARAAGLRERLLLVARELVPAPEFLRWWAPWARRSRRSLAAAYVYRLGWLLAHAVPGWRAWRRARRG